MCALVQVLVFFGIAFFASLFTDKVKSNHSLAVDCWRAGLLFPAIFIYIGLIVGIMLLFCVSIIVWGVVDG